jgi:hypothetical protein
MAMKAESDREIETVPKTTDGSQRIRSTEYNVVCINSLKTDRWLRCAQDYRNNSSKNEVKFHKTSKEDAKRDLACIWLVKPAIWQSMNNEVVVIENMGCPNHYLEVDYSSRGCRVKRCSKPEQCEHILWLISRKKDGDKRYDKISVHPQDGLALAMSSLSKRPVVVDSTIVAENIMKMAIHPVQIKEKKRLILSQDNSVNGLPIDVSCTINAGVFYMDQKTIPKEESHGTNRNIQWLLGARNNKLSDVWKQMDFTWEVHKHETVTVNVSILPGEQIKIFQLQATGGPYRIKTLHCLYK